MNMTAVAIVPPDWVLLGKEERWSTAPEAQGPAGSPSSRPRDGMRVLVVDDDESILDMLGAVLSAEGYSVRVAPDGGLALEMVEAELPSLVLLDMRMPVVDGREFALRLRDRGLAIPIIVMTAGRDAWRSAEEVRADAVLAKPFEIDELLVKVARFRDRPPHRSM